MLSSIPPLQDGKEGVSYDIEPLFTNIPIKEINYTIKQIYVKVDANLFEIDFHKIIGKTYYEMYF